ncbi:DUF1214 domain-containing protein [Actinomadura viridis]|uniref:DUF1214 domain-containing protein n=1 Tax=Actinomadura viridis TaxID=58110 RepID=UPI0036877DA7
MTVRPGEPSPANPGSPPLQSVAAWQELLDSLAEAGGLVAGLAGEAPDIDVAEGFGYVLTALADQFDRSALRGSRSPVFLPAVTPVRKLFFDNPDTDYDIAVLDGSTGYRIRGNRGGSTYLSFCVYSSLSKQATTRLVNLSDQDLRVAADGTFEITLSPERTPGNWMRLDPDAQAVIVRQYFLDRSTEVPAEYRIEALGDRVPDPPLDDARFARTARATARFVKTAAALASERAKAMRPTPNRFVETGAHGPYRTPDNNYVACWYRIQDGEALVLRVRPPECRYWGVHLANRWGQSLDHRTRRTVLNARTAVPEKDGTVRIVVAGTDTGLPNRLDTAGHPEGWILFRWLLAEKPAMPEVERVPLATLLQDHESAAPSRGPGDRGHR